MGKCLALVIHALHGGGAERLLSQLANRWSSQGHRVHVITLADMASDQYPVDQGVVRHGLNLMQTSRGALDGVRANWQRVRSLRSLLGNLSPDFILSFCDRMNITTVTAAGTLGKPLWIAEHSDPARQHLGLLWETWRQWAYRRLAKGPQNGCVVLTESIALTFRNRFPALKTRVIPPAIVLSDCLNAVPQSVSERSAGSGQLLQLLSMGRHSPEKNLEGLLRAWRQIHQQFPQWRLVLAGDGPQHAELVNLVQQLQIGGSVRFAGWVSDPWSLYQQSNLLAMTSHYEGVPVAMLEAMASGVPCVSTPCSTSVREFAQAGAVELAASGSPEDIGRALSVVMADATYRNQLAERGRVTAQQFSWAVIGPRWDELLSNPA